MMRRIAHFVAFFAVLLAPTLGHAQGFAISDLSSLGDDAAAALGPEYIFRAEPKRISLICTTCAGVPMIDIQLSRQDDGTEDRVRSGETSMADLEGICRNRSEECRIDALEVNPAVGWTSRYRSVFGDGVTAVIILDGHLLTVRVIGGRDGEQAIFIERLMPLIRSRIIAQ